MNTLCINLVQLMFEVSVRINACWINISKLHGAFDFTFMESLCDVLLFLWANKNSLFLDPCQMIVKSHVLHLFAALQTGSHYNKHLISRQVFKTKNCNPFQSSSGLSICVSFSNCCVIYTFFLMFGGSSHCLNFDAFLYCLIKSSWNRNFRPSANLMKQ